MLEYREKAILEVAACTCDRCGLRMSPEDGEWHERVSLSWRSGFHSVFGDCSELSLDMCQHCVKATLGEWIRVSRRDPDDGLTDQRSQVLAGAPSSPTSVVDAAYLDSLPEFIKAVNELVEKNGLPLEGSQNLEKPRSIAERAGCVKPPVSGVCVDDMKAWHESPSVAWRLPRLATQVWDDAADADTWMHRPHPELGGKTPYEAATTDSAGAERVEAILGRIVHGIPT
ncbi:MbcA/ParS/Xre antitoxin family protein [Paraburkholderia flagellata]|uniref:MbcA/ParS/Xre antitoxin family protein n=1 Tax=Paraburkholderia flagellata TaxID=2883241 RepID=UPI001F22F4AD|nr:MbcA/ParS/Xre antitoxin family protein [Paraburkholderia flagellata]